MALIVKIQINTDTIRTYSARNITGKTSGWNKYLVQSAEKPWEIKSLGEIRHKYEDGADVLALKVMRFVCYGRKEE